MSIDKCILYEILSKHITKKNFNKYKTIKSLLKIIIFNDPTKNVIKIWYDETFDKVPANRSLFKSWKNKWLPIWNFTSQFFANVYLNELDQYIKRELRQRNYFRYVDDFVLLWSKNDLEKYERYITKFLFDKLKLNISQKKIKFHPVYFDLDFIWYVIKKKKYIVPRYRNIKSFKNIIYKIDITDKNTATEYLSKINSYCWFFNHTKSFYTREKYLKLLDQLVFNPNKFYSYITKNFIVYDILFNSNLKTMKKYDELESKYKNYIIFMQVWCFYKCFWLSSIYIAKQLWLKTVLFNPRTKWERFMCWFHIDVYDKYLWKIKELKINSIFVMQKKDEKWVIERVIKEIITYDKDWKMPIIGTTEMQKIRTNYYEKTLGKWVSIKNNINEITNNPIQPLENEQLFISEFKKIDILSKNMYEVIEFIIKWKKILTNKTDW